MNRPTSRTASAYSPTLSNLNESFKRTLLAENKSPRTITAYTEGVRLLDEFLESQGMPSEVANIAREHLEAFIADLLTRWKPATASNRYRALQAFFKWCAVEGEVKESPMTNMSPPKVPEVNPPVLSTDELRRLVKACEGTDFIDRRDMAIVLLFIDTGCRRSELAQLAVDDVDFASNVIRVVGKGGRERVCAFGRKTALALDRYLRARVGHAEAIHTDALWLGHMGKMAKDGTGLSQAVERRALAAGIESKVNLHRFRHSFAHRWLSLGGNEGDLMALAGWRSRTMIMRYAASTAADRAVEAHKRIGIADQLLS